MGAWCILRTCHHLSAGRALEVRPNMVGLELAALAAAEDRGHDVDLEGPGSPSPGPARFLNLSFVAGALRSERVTRR